MDPICHTLTGAALARTGLERTTRYGRLTLIVAANLPDIDVVAHFMDGTASYAFRRGITHGIPALFVLPTVLALLVLGWHRLRGTSGDSPGPSLRWLLILAFIGVWSHPILDWMNTYGMRWLMPMVNEWYYGDTLFIVDWILWLALGAGLIAGRERFSTGTRWYAQPATLALFFMAGYIAANFQVTRLAEEAAMLALENDRPARILASPVPFDPRRRRLVLEYAGEYRFADYNLGREQPFTMSTKTVGKGNPENLQRVAATRQGGWFVHWARFPYSRTETIDGQRFITVADARYVPDITRQRADGFAVFRMPADAASGSTPSD